MEPGHQVTSAPVYDPVLHFPWKIIDAFVVVLYVNNHRSILNTQHVQNYRHLSSYFKNCFLFTNALSLTKCWLELACIICRITTVIQVGPGVYNPIHYG